MLLSQGIQGLGGHLSGTWDQGQTCLQPEANFFITQWLCRSLFPTKTEPVDPSSDRVELAHQLWRLGSPKICCWQAGEPTLQFKSKGREKLTSRFKGRQAGGTPFLSYIQPSVGWTTPTHSGRATASLSLPT